MWYSRNHELPRFGYLEVMKTQIGWGFVYLDTFHDYQLLLAPDVHVHTDLVLNKGDWQLIYETAQDFTK